MKPSSYLILGMVERGARRVCDQARLFFADAMAPEESLELIAAREGADYSAWRAAWFRELENELADELDAHGR